MSRLPDIANPHRKLYPSDLSDAEWTIIAPLLPPPKRIGHPVKVDFREIINGILYVQRTGCQWEMMPHDLPPYGTVYGYFQKWRRRGVWQAMESAVRRQLAAGLDQQTGSRPALKTVARRLKSITEMFA